MKIIDDCCLVKGVAPTLAKSLVQVLDKGGPFFGRGAYFTG